MLNLVMALLRIFVLLGFGTIWSPMGPGTTVLTSVRHGGLCERRLFLFLVAFIVVLI
jgi:hypothetical protein